jgi:competence protein ComEA
LIGFYCCLPIGALLALMLVESMIKGVSIMNRLVKGLWLLGVSALLPLLVHAGPVNINTADAKTLAAELDGVGPALAAAIIRDREEHGPYESAEQLARVKGIGDRVLEKNKDNILVEDESSRAH